MQEHTPLKPTNWLVKPACCAEQSATPCLPNPPEQPHSGLQLPRHRLLLIPGLQHILHTCPPKGQLHQWGQPLMTRWEGAPQGARVDQAQSSPGPHRGGKQVN